MDIGEAVNILDQATNEDQYCGGKKMDNPGWKVVIDGIKGGTGDPAVLRQNMLAAEYAEPDSQHGHSVHNCSESSFPYQTHHLVPEKQLPDHKVCVWLTDSPKKQDDNYKLKWDTNYDTNGGDNGYFMPFASTTIEWLSTTSGARHALICYEMMRRTRTQLHQGPHSKTDYLEEPDIEHDSYKGKVEEFLTTIADRAASHVEACPKCKDQMEGGKIPVQPLESIVRQMYLVAELLIALVDFNRIFVSRRAADYFKLYKGQHPANPLI
jgi:hypothetical protein